MTESHDNMEERVDTPSSDEVVSENDLDFLEADLDEDPVSRDLAILDFRRWLKSWKLLRKAVRKFKDKREQEDAEKSKEIIIDAIMAGRLELQRSANGNHVLQHNLLEAMGRQKVLTYKGVSKLSALRKIDEFDDGNDFGKLQGMVAALSGTAIAECRDMIMSDIDIVASVFYFFG